MKVLLINGSPHVRGCTYIALKEVADTLNDEGIETEIIQVGKFEQCDGIVIGSPVYYASANGNLISFLDRLFYSHGFDKTMKVGASVVSARRGGTTATFDELNKYFTISSMPIASSQYWNNVHGNNIEEVKQDKEGLQIMRTLGRNMAFLIKSINLGKKEYGLPKKEERVSTNFIK